jgi:hypothetical protein
VTVVVYFKYCLEKLRKSKKFSSITVSRTKIGTYDLLNKKCHTQSDWVFGLCPSSGILETRENSSSETGSVSVLR